MVTGWFATMQWGMGDDAIHRKSQVEALGGLGGWVSGHMSRMEKTKKSKTEHVCVEGHRGACMCVGGFAAM